MILSVHISDKDSYAASTSDRYLRDGDWGYLNLILVPRWASHTTYTLSADTTWECAAERVMFSSVTIYRTQQPRHKLSDGPDRRQNCSTSWEWQFSCISSLFGLRFSFTYEQLDGRCSLVQVPRISRHLHKTDHDRERRTFSAVLSNPKRDRSQFPEALLSDITSYTVVILWGLDVRKRFTRLKLRLRHIL